MNLIPPGKIDSVSRGLSEAFRVTSFDSITPVTGGHTTSLVFRIIVRGSPYLLKLILRTSRGPIPEDHSRHFSSMSAAAAAGLAPRVWYANPEDQILITDFVTVSQQPPLRPPRSQALIQLPAMLRTLHSLQPPFPSAPFNTTTTFLIHNKGPMLQGFLQRFRTSPGNPLLSPADMCQFFAIYEQLAAVYPEPRKSTPQTGEDHAEEVDPDMVASHNDLFKPDNILYDGDRMWFVDWEAAFRNDRYADLAVVAHQVVANEEEERIFLREYFSSQEPGGAASGPTPYQQARFHLMQQLTHLFYTMAFLHTGAAADANHGGSEHTGGSVEPANPVDACNAFYHRMWSASSGGIVDLSDPSTKLEFARIHWQRLQHNVSQPRFQDSLRIVAAGAPTSQKSF